MARRRTGRARQPATRRALREDARRTEGHRCPPRTSTCREPPASGWAGPRLRSAPERRPARHLLGRVAVVGSPDYFARHGKPRRPRDLARHTCISYRRITTGEVYRWQLSEGGKDLEIAVHGRLTVNDGDASLRAAIAGVGLAHLLESMARPAIADGRLVRVLAPYCPPFPGLFLYYPSRAQMPPKLSVLVEFLRWRRPRGSTERAASA